MSQNYFWGYGSVLFLRFVRHSLKTASTEDGSQRWVEVSVMACLAHPRDVTRSNRPEIHRLHLPPHQATVVHPAPFHRSSIAHFSSESQSRIFMESGHGCGYWGRDVRDQWWNVSPLVRPVAASSLSVVQRFCLFFVGVQSQIGFPCRLTGLQDQTFLV